ncbi:SHOCT domain-containing protein [Mycobacterium deserti]|uniref:SHOCT domain-containing protein n=1 Tax=Mycobacterium deserti TaxID=2978347 RepID=A0ABT2MDG4_9MYCO|nr:SHOCT domain-containing protein [Mycobacterium deserti]MCT7660299.1 SHOCT domain-containing protein [Mycobacterium deserti]
MTLAPRIAIGASVLTLVAAIIGFVVVIILNAFVLDEYDAYGEVAIPGAGTVELPEGEVTISFHTLITGRPSGGGLPVPDLQLSITPPEGAPDPRLAESFGSTTTVNNDARVQVWQAQVYEAGTYGIVADGEVGGYIQPRLAFGKDGSMYWLLWVFGGLFGIGLLELTASLMWAGRAGKKTRPLTPQELSTLDTPTWAPSPTVSYPPSDQGVRLEQLKTLAALRDSGALTNDEFEAEKRRILEWGHSGS